MALVTTRHSRVRELELPTLASKSRDTRNFNTGTLLLLSALSACDHQLGMSLALFDSRRFLRFNIELPALVSRIPETREVNVALTPFSK